MMREKVLVLLLIISVFGNVYLLFTDNPDATSFLPGVNASRFDSLFGLENASPGNVSYTDEFGHPIVFATPIPTPEVTFELPGEGTELLENESRNVTVIEATPTPTVIPTTPAPVDPFVTYKSAKHGFSLRYPRNWTINEAPAGRTVLTLGAPIETMCDSDTNQCYKYVANFTVEIDQNPSTTVIEDYFNKAVSRLQLDYFITTTSKSAATQLSSAKAYQIEYYTHDKRGNAVRSFMQYYTIIDGKAYIISYFGPYSIRENVYNHNKADAQGVIDSIEITRSFKPV